MSKHKGDKVEDSPTKKISYQFLFADGDFPRQTVGLLEFTII